MLLAALLALPWYADIPAYFLIGVVWACFYLPRAIRLQATAYAAWRDTILHGRNLTDVLGAETRGDAAGLMWESMEAGQFLTYRDYHPKPDTFTERRIIAGFMLNIAAWPLRIPQKLITDYLRSVWALLRRLLRTVWRAISRACRWAFDHVVALYRVIIQSANREAIADLAKLNGEEGGK